MYNAYCLEEVVSNLPIEALSISNHVAKDILFIGSKPGHLLCCNHIVEGNNNHYEYIVTRNFEKRPVIDLKVIEQMDFIACLTDSNFSVHEATQPYRLVATTTKYKPIFNFTFHVEQQKFAFFLLALKNRLVLIKMLNNEMEEIANINLVDTSIKSFWCNNSIFIAMKNEYQFAKLAINCKDPDNLIADILEQPRNLFSISQNSSENQPLLINIKDKSLVGICREDKTVDFVDIGSGNLAGINICRFSDVICELAYDSPYLIGILSSNIVEIRTISPLMFIQKISIPKVSMLSVGMRGSIYCANEGQAWKLNALTNLQQNFKFLKNEKQFELALQLAQSYQPLIDQNQVIDLKKNIAANYFLEQKFTKSFGIHIELNTDILFIINLFNEFVPEKYAPLISRFKEEDLQMYNISQKQIIISDRKYAIQALVEYLSTKRNEHSKLVNLHYMDYRDGRDEHILSVNELKRNEASLELIDTVLLKCYIQISPTLVGSLLRSKNCSCIISEAEKDLKSSKMFDELLILYKQKKIYRKFLEFLKREVKKDETPNKLIIEKITSFLMELKQEHFSLIAEFSPLIFNENINLGIKIFTKGEDAKNFDRELVLQYLKRDYPQAVISYLEYIIYNWNDLRPKFHEELLSQYIARVRTLMAAYVKSLAGNNAILASSANEQPDELTILRMKLRKFLEQDKNYTIKDAFELIKSDQNLVEEKAVLYGRMGQHLEALNIYINILMNFDAAEHHCQIYYNEKNGKTSKLFYNLFHFYITGNINPATKNENGEQNFQQKRQNLTEALKLLRRHPTKINIVSAFSLIPSDIPLQRICGALIVVFEAFNNRLTSVNMMLSLTNITMRRVEMKLNSLKKQRIQINEMVECIICGKRIMDSAFVRCRDFSISHFFCHKTNLERRQQRIDYSPLDHKKQSH